MVNEPMLTLALEMTSETMGIIAGVGVATLAVAYFGIKFWLVSTRPPAIPDVHTPTVDRLNRSALEHMAEETLEQDEAETAALQEEEAPQDLKALVPDDPSLAKNGSKK
jgi:hypothetical protein